MTRLPLLASAVSGFAALLLPLGIAAGATPTPGIVSHIKVVSDRVADVSSLEAWKESFIHDAMTDREKAVAIWTSVCQFRHQAPPPVEGLIVGPPKATHVHDPIKAFNVYGYGQCCCASGHIETLARYVGLETRGWGINAHSVPEIKIDGRWCMFDASLMNYFLLPDGRTIAGVDEIHASIVDWLERNPANKGRTFRQLEPQMRNGGWKSGPAVLAGGTGYDRNGWLPAATHSWGSSMIEFGGAEVPGGKKAFLFDYGTAIGYEVNIQLRRGERMIRRWSNQGHHVNEADGDEYPVNDRQLGYAAKWGDLNPATRIGNGTIEYRLPLAGGLFRPGMLAVDNLALAADAPGAAIHVRNPARDGVLVFRMPSSYVYLAGQLELSPVIGAGGAIVVSLSDNHGLDWKKVGTITGSSDQTLDLTAFVRRRYDYQLRFEFKGAGTGINALAVINQIQHSTRALPALAAGDNTLTFSAGAPEGTITIQGKTDGEAGNLTLKDFHPDFDGAKTVIPLRTPGELTRIRASASYRCSTEQQGFLVQASFDGGSSYVDLGRFDGAGRGNSRYLVFDRIPGAIRSALIRLVAEGKPTLWDLRIDADYLEPRGGFAPVKVTYVYTEAGEEKTEVHLARSARERYSIHCGAKPQMKSLTLELAD